MKIKMYEVHVYEACSWDECGSIHLCLEPRNISDRDYKCETLDEFECELPEGHYVAKSVCGELHIYDSNNKYCPISYHNGIISILSSDRWIKIGEWEHYTSWSDYHET